jgi:hypothetical protein
MDGRTQMPANEWMKRACGVDFVDTVSEPGPDGILAERTDEVLVESIKHRVHISCKAHNSPIVAIVAHHDCAGNPVDEETHLKQLQKAKATILAWGFPMEVIMLWIDETWTVHRIEEAPVKAP